MEQHHAEQRIPGLDCTKNGSQATRACLVGTDELTTHRSGMAKQVKTRTTESTRSHLSTGRGQQAIDRREEGIYSCVAE